jgi:hypothetical protein
VDPRWIIQPLLNAGLGLDDVRDYMFRLSFECIVTSDQHTVSDVDAFVGQQRAEIRAAWIETIDRMLATHDPVDSERP